MLKLIRVGEGLLSGLSGEDLLKGGTISQTRWPCGHFACDNCGTINNDVKFLKSFKEFYHS